METQGRSTEQLGFPKGLRPFGGGLEAEPPTFPIQNQGRGRFAAPAFTHSFLPYAIFLPMSTPMTEAIMSPRVQPDESPRQNRFWMLVLRFSSILTRLE